MILAIKWVQIVIIPSFWLKFDEVTVTMSFIVLSWICVGNVSVEQMGIATINGLLDKLIKTSLWN